MSEPISEDEHQEALAHTLPYEWIVQALSFASLEITDDLVDILERALEDAPPRDRLAQIRMKLLLDALHEGRGVPRG